MSNNKVKYGLKNVYYAVATIDEDNKATYGSPKKWPGAVSLSLDAQGDTTKFRADNMNYWIGQSNNGYEGDFESALIPDSFRQDVLGDIVDGDGATYEDADAKTVYFALLFQFEGDANAIRHVLYNCKATRPTLASETTDTSIEPVTETMSITAIARTMTVGQAQIPIVKAKCEPSDTAYNSFFTTVQVPGA